MNNVLLVAVLHRRYDLYEGKKRRRDKQSLVKRLVFSDSDKGSGGGGGGGGDVVDTDRKDKT